MTYIFNTTRPEHIMAEVRADKRLHWLSNHLLLSVF